MYNTGEIEMDTLLTVRQTAQLLNVSEHTVYRYIQQRKIRYQRIGRTLRIYPDQFNMKGQR